ncbi:MAG: prolyl-tRNA synthetase associated domain-containing protein [bacterium]
MVDIYAELANLGIAYVRYDHAPVFTCEEADAAVLDPDAVQTKNLFLRDKRGRRHVLLVTTCAKSVDINRFAEQIDADRLSFASPERMAKYLGVTPGSVTVLGLIADTANAVEVYVDADVWNSDKWRCHPMINSATLVLSRAGVETFLAHTKHVPRVLAIATREDPGAAT